jgi:alkylation response protein AidB-like acyl-CoA dehydrogenase
VIAVASKRRSSAYSHAADLENFLGDPMVPGTPYSYREIVAREDFPGIPDGTRELVERWRYHEFLVPVELGGRLRSLDEVFLLCRTLSRRNLNIAAMFGSALLAATPVWLSGSPAQKRALASEFLDGGLACFGVSEAEHGSDLHATETVLERKGEELRLTGTKWPVGNAIRGRFVTTLAKSGPAAFSLVLADKARLPADCWSTLPFVRMVGLKGHDVSGIEFRDAPLPGDAFVGPEGTGLAQVLKALQVTRIATAALSLGTMDAVLRIALRYACERRLYGEAIVAIPVISDQLMQSHLDLLIGECVALPASRALSLAPERISLWSSIVKYLVPVIAEQAIASMGVVLGARGYLCEGVAYGAFQKLQRDHAMASVFEGTTHVNLQWIAAQLPAVAAHLDDLDEASAGGLLEQLFSQYEDTPAWAPDGRRLRLANGGRDEITQGWPLAVRRLASLGGDPQAPSVCGELLALCRKVSDRREAFYRRIRLAGAPRALSVQAQADATTQCVLYAISSCVLMWLHNRAELGGHFADGGWLVLCLQRLLRRLDVFVEVNECHGSIFTEHMLRCAAEGTGCSLMSLAAH